MGMQYNRFSSVSLINTHNGRLDKKKLISYAEYISVASKLPRYLRRSLIHLLSNACHRLINVCKLDRPKPLLRTMSLIFFLLPFKYAIGYTRGISVSGIKLATCRCIEVVVH